MASDTRKTTIYLVRHGEPAEEFRDRFYGQMDVPLSERGVKQSKAASERLASIKFDAVYSSDLQRAWIMGEALAEPHGLPVRRLESLRERKMGFLQGLSEEEMREAHPEHYRQFMANRAMFHVEGGENFERLSARVVPTLRELALSFEGGRVAVATHAGPIRVAVADALGMPLANAFNLTLDYACVTVIEYAISGPAKVKLVNG